MTKAKANPNWPVLETYDVEHLRRIALPLGGIGTGTVSLGGRGNLRDWEIANRPAKGFNPYTLPYVHYTFFAVYAKPAGGRAVTRLLEGPFDTAEYEGQMGCSAINHGMPRFRECSFAAAYPLGQVLLSDPDVPVTARLEAFNPLVPCDADTSGMPIAVLRYVITNRTNKPMDVSVCGSMPNFIGWDGTENAPKANRNRFRTSGKVRGIFMDSPGVDRTSAAWGTMALATAGGGRVSHRTCWPGPHAGSPLTDFWDDFADDGAVDPRTKPDISIQMASLAAKAKLGARQSRAFTFLIAWHYPNRVTWTPGPAGKKKSKCDCAGACDENVIGNYYTTQYRDAWDAAAKCSAALPKAEAKTVQFVRAVADSDLPAPVKDAAMSNLSSLRTQTTFRTPDGKLFGFEGCGDNAGCCHGSCTHVWNYEQAVAHLFGDLAMTMRDTEFAHATGENGLMSFRVNLPLSRARDYGGAAADGQMGCVMKMYRDWQLSGDDAALRRLWPEVRKAVEFCWLPGGWDGDRDGVMEGSQHNTMDCNYWGPNPQMGIWYLGALRAAEEMARYIGQDDFADTCRDLFTHGSGWLDENLFNGEYYEQDIRPPKKNQPVLPGTGTHPGKAMTADELIFQLGKGCLVDQLVGQFMAHICGLGYLTKRANVRRALRAIVKYNTQDGFHDHFNCMRGYAVGDERALLMAAFPKGRPKHAFPYWSEVMTGFEYTAAIGMIQEGMRSQGVGCIADIRDRYDGQKRSPFDEAECGHHYARAMASWAAIPALTGFRYSGVTATMEFAATKKASKVFWSNGYAWGTVKQRGETASGLKVELEVLGGTLKVRTLTLTGAGAVAYPRVRTVTAGKTLKATIGK